MTYLLILLFLLGCMTLLDARFGLFFWSRPWKAALVLALGIVYFLSWDLWAIAAGIFLHRDSPLMTGIMLADQLPLEEPVFLLFLSYQTMIAFTGCILWLRHLARDKTGHRATVQEGPVGS
ncbi:MAG: lycopene cyclase domain-containing protein [Arthrobacter sp.]|uniref:lycopene cyclase domain-containing protein n=1 Tax=unclassified Arthrobacter TaxID=235627 RepID=UPI00264AECD4|nr:lycopene cyclase domain-containing protein [Micrococcaceae bacterium]